MASWDHVNGFMGSCEEPLTGGSFVFTRSHDPIFTIPRSHDPTIPLSLCYALRAAFRIVADGITRASMPATANSTAKPMKARLKSADDSLCA